MCMYMYMYMYMGVCGNARFQWARGQPNRKCKLQPRNRDQIRWTEQQHKIKTNASKANKTIYKVQWMNVLIFRKSQSFSLFRSLFVAEWASEDLCALFQATGDRMDSLLIFQHTKFAPFIVQCCSQANLHFDLTLPILKAMCTVAPIECKRQPANSTIVSRCVLCKWD